MSTREDLIALVLKGSPRLSSDLAEAFGTMELVRFAASAEPALIHLRGFMEAARESGYHDAYSPSGDIGKVYHQTLLALTEQLLQLQQENAELLRFARRDGPLFRHKNGTLYQEVGRNIAPTSYPGDTNLPPHRDFGALVTDTIFRNEQYVLYRNAKGEYFARPARLFDEPERFRRLTP